MHLIAIFVIFLKMKFLWLLSIFKSWSMSRKSEDREEKTPNVLKEGFINLTSLYSCFKDLIKSRYFSFLRDMLVWRLVSKPTASSKCKNICFGKITVDQALGCPLLSPKDLKSLEDQDIVSHL